VSSRSARHRLRRVDARDSASKRKGHGSRRELRRRKLLSGCADRNSRGGKYSHQDQLVGWRNFARPYLRSAIDVDTHFSAPVRAREGSWHSTAERGAADVRSGGPTRGSSDDEGASHHRTRPNAGNETSSN